MRLGKLLVGLGWKGDAGPDVSRRSDAPGSSIRPVEGKRCHS